MKSSILTRSEWFSKLIAAAEQKEARRVYHLIVFHEFRLERMVDVDLNAQLWTELYCGRSLGEYLERQKTMQEVAALLRERAQTLFGEAGRAEEFLYLHDLADNFFCYFKISMGYFTVPTTESAM